MKTHLPAFRSAATLFLGLLLSACPRPSGEAGAVPGKGVERCPASGRYFDITAGYSLYLDDEFLYFLTPDRPNHRLMCHLVDENDGFINLDSEFDPLYGEDLPFDTDLWVSRIALDCDLRDRKLRVGGYVRGPQGIRNLWSQEISLPEIDANELLTRDGER